jgi:8-oxo-dGTP diphosphatase
MTIPTNLRPPKAQAEVAADVVLFTLEDQTLKTLLIQRTGEPFKDRLALPGGFLWEGESTLDTAKRILNDKAGVQNSYLEQLYTFDAPGRDPRGQVVSVTYMALAHRAELTIEASPTTQQPALHNTAQLPALAFDHTKVLAYAIARLRSKLEYTNAVAALLPRQFTFAALQQAYEVILARPLDRRNFRKKFLSLGLIKATGQFAKAAHRPAELFEFTAAEQVELKRWF